jgi:hypothetical protein
LNTEERRNEKILQAMNRKKLHCRLVKIIERKDHDLGQYVPYSKEWTAIAETIVALRGMLVVSAGLNHPFFRRGKHE